VHTRSKIIHYGLCWASYAFLHGAATAAWGVLPCDAAVTAAILFTAAVAVLERLLALVIRFGKLEQCTPVWQYGNAAIMAALFILCALTVTYGGMYCIYGDTYFLLFLSMLPAQILTGSLLFIVLWQYHHRVAPPAAEQPPKQIDTPTAADAPEEPVTTTCIDRIAIKDGVKIDIILTPDIFYLQAYGDYVVVFTHDRKYMKEQTMKYFEESLPPQLFVRVHRSYIVNVAQISRIELHEKQTQQITLKNGHQLKVSAAGYKALRVALGL
jgi:hypothetical protein